MQEVPLFPWWVPLFLTIWGVVGPIFGLVAGHYLTASSERKRWIADNQKEEYRRLLAALSKVNVALADFYAGHGDPQKIHDGLEEVSQASNTCLFINDFLENSKVLSDIEEAAQSLINGGDFNGYRKKYWFGINQIINSAKKIRS